MNREEYAQTQLAFDNHLSRVEREKVIWLTEMGQSISMSERDLHVYRAAILSAKSVFSSQSKK